MATLGTNNLTLVDVTKRQDPNGQASAIAELMMQRNDVLQDINWVEGNLPTGHRTTMRTGLPTVAWRLLNAGVSPSKSTTAQVDESCGILEAWSVVDKDLAELNGNVAATRLSEAKAFLEAMNEEFTGTLFYGNSSISPEEFTGLSIRYSSTTAANGQNIITGGGSGNDMYSIWLICHSPETFHGIYPKGSIGGLTHDDRGIETVEVSGGISGTHMLAYRERWQWKCGIALKDWRYVVRIANIDLSANNADLIDLMIKATHRIPNPGMGNCAFYMNRTAFQRLDLLRRDDVISGGGLVYNDVDGRLVPHFRQYPIRICDQLLESESSIS